MVSGLVTSPCDQLRIFSGEARLMRMESKSLIALPRSNGLERYKVSSCRSSLSRPAVGFRFVSDSLKPVPPGSDAEQAFQSLAASHLNQKRETGNGLVGCGDAG